MPTFNQLVRKGRRGSRYQVYGTGSSGRLQLSEEEGYRSVRSAEARRLHHG